MQAFMDQKPLLQTQDVQIHVLYISLVVKSWPGEYINNSQSDSVLLAQERDYQAVNLLEIAGSSQGDKLYAR